MYMYNWITFQYTWKVLINYTSIKIKLKKIELYMTPLNLDLDMKLILKFRNLFFLNIGGGFDFLAIIFIVPFWKLNVERLTLSLQILLWAVLGLVTRSCPTLCDPTDCSPPGSSVHGDSPGKNTRVGCHALLQGIFPTQGQRQVSCIAGRFFIIWATREAWKVPTLIILIVPKALGASE